ncbi:energy transducer TonB [uncultured Aquimarina sp.]|uniref:energy transducer TonB n=1 Tax=uncultured Aquimarina sp. TaxID=575652 RepID=UPI0026291B1D|nr:energy transducer TonB [uncultured Aquimarina sp.]
MSNKHDANVRKSTLVNFQIGLIASLLFAFVMFEMYTSVSVVRLSKEPFEYPIETVAWNGDFKEYVEPKEKVVVEKIEKQNQAPEEFKIIEKGEELSALGKEFLNKPSAGIVPFNIDSLDHIEDPVQVEKLRFIAVEGVPVFPGCENLETNDEKAACFSEKINRWVSDKFNASLGEKYGLTGRQRISVEFEVNKDGTVQNIKARAAHKALEKEAIRVTKTFPKMTPGKQRGKAVDVVYQLPIVFKIQD